MYNFVRLGPTIPFDFPVLSFIYVCYIFVTSNVIVFAQLCIAKYVQW